MKGKQKENKFLTDYFDHQLKSIEEGVYACKKSISQERLHQIRVDIKKIKALFSFVDAVYKKESDLKALKPVFRGAGRIREIQLNIKLLQKLPHPPKRLIDRLKKEEQKLKLNWKEKIPLNVKRIKKLKKKNSIPDSTLHKKEVKKHFKKRLRKAIKKFSNTNRTDMHSFRKRIKELMYLYHFLPEKFQNTIKLHTDFIDQVQEKVGKWHDVYAALTFFSHQAPNSKTHMNIPALKAKEEKLFAELISNKQTLRTKMNG